MLADWSARIHPESGGGGMSFSTNNHGFRSLQIPLVPMTLDEAFAVYSWPGTPHVTVSDGGDVVWEGRLEDISIVEGGIRATALGYARAYWDVPYTALWSKSGSGGWKEAGIPITSGEDPAGFEMDNNNRLYWAFQAGTVYLAARQAGFYYSAPSNGQRKITSISFDYNMVMPTNWRLKVFQTDNFSSGTNTTVVTGNGGTQTGSYTQNFGTAVTHVVLRLENNTGGDYTADDYPGGYYLRLTNIRLKTTTAASVLASDIATTLGLYVNSINDTQVGNVSMKVEATTTDLLDELYEDIYPAEILDRLALLHDYEWGVYEGRHLHFRPRGSAGREWYVDVTRIMNLERSLEEVRNSAYATYRDANGAYVRTAVADDADSQEQWGVVRRGTVRASTTSATEAGIHRDTYLSDRAARIMRADISFEHLYDASGREHPLYVLRAGDIVTMRNLAPTLSPDIDNIRSFIVGETEYDAATNRIRISPATPTPELSRLVARRDAGVR